MKYFIFLFIYLFSNITFASFDIETITYTSCERLKYPREKVEMVLESIYQKLDECNENQLNCNSYQWPTSVKDKTGDQLTSSFTTVNLWDLKNTYIKALDCDFCKMTNPNQECGITDFGN